MVIDWSIISRWFWSSVSLAVMLFARKTVKCLWCVTIRLFVTAEYRIYIVSQIVCYPVILSLLVFLLPYGRVRELILISDQLLLRPLFGISEVVAYERFDCSLNLVNSVWTTSTFEVLHYFHVCLVVLYPASRVSFDLHLGRSKETLLAGWSIYCT